MSATYQAQNPFNQFAAPPAANQPPQQYGQYPQPPQPPQQQYGQPPQQQYGQPPQQQYSQPPQQQPPQQPPQQQSQQLVVAAQPSNPYAGIVAPQQQQQASPWDAPAAAPAPMTASASSFDPFAAPPPPPAPAPAPPAPAPPAPAYGPAPAPPSQQAYSAAPTPQDPWAAPSAPSQSFSAPPQQQSYQAPAPAAADNYQVPKSFSNDDFGYNSNRQIVPANSRSNYDDDNHEKNKDMRNPYSNALAHQVQGTKASGLPKAELVGKKGFVLSRISFRTIVMKKWKQSFWVQYGGHTMLWFRNKEDFNDWLNNPYHTQMQRNFLIKLAINFVHDLYKPNVRGYQVTQCRTKPYGNNKVVRQFKLERWMDYGPTIAAAFGSYDPKEVDACREAIVECMKNTPLDNGIRATGAVKEHHERKQQEELAHMNNGQNGAYNNYSINGANPAQAPRSMPMPEVDLLGDMNTGGNDSTSVPPGAYAPAPTGDLLGDAASGALVPAVNPNAAYPGAPPPPQAVSQQPAFYPSTPQRMSHGQMQPQYPAQPPAAPPAYGGAPAPQVYPGQQQPQYQQPQYQQPQYQQPQQSQYPTQAPAPAFAQPPAQAGYPYQQQQQQPSAGYPPASYPVPTQQF